MSIKEMTDVQVVRLYRRVINRVWEWNAGGTNFCVDWRTLNAERPGLSRTYNKARAELRRRNDGTR